MTEDGVKHKGGVVLRAVDHIQSFLRHESISGLLLILAAAIAMVMANHPLLAPLYDAFLHVKASVKIGSIGLEKGLLHWINDGLMAIFFLLVGLELKREFYAGELSSRERIVMPALAALGGMVVPALIFVAINGANPENLRGWAIPTATDIAFALGILALLGRRVPLALKTFLLALAMFDDLGAIVIIALFYTDALDLAQLAAAGTAIALLLAFNRLLRIRSLAPYIIVGVVMWAAVLKSGIHATLAGFVLALTIPYITARERGTEEVRHVPDNPALVLEHMLQPWVAWFIMPIFAFANAGVRLDGDIGAVLVDPLTLGVALGLFLGKQAGVVGAVLAGRALGWLRLPPEMGVVHLWGVGLLAGIGFTMSLFIGSLSFASPDQETAMRVGVLSGTILSALAGWGLLAMSLPRKPARRERGGFGE
ncbi:MAG TPA: Na+/H+ antiporter NhaA [Thermopetrobacter sp.]|nr:Na+/H+ antiporter NhaA [Thermopetrobacter sp.]